MALIVPNDGEIDGLKYFVNKAVPENLVLRLFTNDITPSEDDETADYTEASGFGYASITLNGASWSDPTGSPATTSYPEQTFTFSGAIGNIYGYYLTRASSNKIAYAERFATPFNVQSSGSQLKLTLSISLD